MKRIYLDYAATTPMLPEVFREMRPYFEKEFGNPGSLHSFGQEAIKAVDFAREKIATALNAEFREIIFTGSATEANNLALEGAIRKFQENFPGRIPEMIISAIEHESVLSAALALERLGIKMTVLPVNKAGKVNLKDLRSALSKDTAIVSIIYGNNETGAVEPIGELGDEIKKFRGNGIYPLYHSDCSQAFQFLPCIPKDLNLDLLTISSHKIYGPKGIAALYVRNAVKDYIAPLVLGGGQEYGLRSGTENVPLIAGFGKAAEIAVKNRKLRVATISGLKARLIKELKKISGIKIHAGELPHIVNFSVAGLNSGAAMAAFDLGGIAISSGSACKSRTFLPSHVLHAMGLPSGEVITSLRVSLGEPSKIEDLKEFIKILKKIRRNMKTK